MFDRREKNIEVFENSVSMMKNNIKLKAVGYRFYSQADGIFRAGYYCNS